MADLPSLLLAGIVALTVVVIVATGADLARTGDQLSERTGLGQVFIGALLIAGATSLPELGTDVTAAATGAPDLAIGDLFGSSMANMAILAAIDLRYRGRLFPVIELGHTRLAAVAIGLTALAVMAVATTSPFDILGVGPTSIGLGAIYLAALAWFRRVPAIGAPVATPTPFRAPPVTDERAPLPSIRRLAVRLAVAAALLCLATPLLTVSAEEVSHRSGIAQSTIGVTLVAMTTSLPELATSFAAVRIGAHGLAVGNLFGSNAANMAMIVVIDAVYRDGPILDAVDDRHVVAGTAAILLMALALAGIVSGQANRARRFEPDSAVLLVAYVASLVAVTAA